MKECQLWATAKTGNIIHIEYCVDQARNVYEKAKALMNIASESVIYKGTYETNCKN